MVGNFPDVSFPDLIQFYCMSKKTVAIRVSTPDLPEGRGEFFVADGELLDARSGRDDVLQEEEALPSSRPCPDCGTWHAEDAYCPEPATQPVHTGPSVELSAPELEVSIPDVGEGEGEEQTEAKRKLAGLFILGGCLLAGILAVFVLFLFLKPKERARTLSEAATTTAPATAPAAAVTAPPVLPAVQGVSADSIVFGLAAPFSGPSKELGRQMKVGLEAAFAQVNDVGGVHGRKLLLVPEDDGLEPSRTPAALRTLWEKRKVFALVGNVAAANAMASVPFVLERRTLLLGAFSGAQVLRRDPPDRYVFNLRASDAEEAVALVRFLVRRGIRPEQICLFGEEGPGSEAAYQGVLKLLRRDYKLQTLLRVGYPRNTLDVDDAVQRIRLHVPPIRAVVMVASYRAAARFVARLRAVAPGVSYASVSGVGATTLAEELQQLGQGIGDGVIVTQVVPPVDSGASAVLGYKRQLERTAPDERPDAVSFEGYLVGRLLAEGLQRAGRDLDVEKLVDAFESMRDVDLGTGTKMSYGPSEHQASHRVWGTVLDARGRYQVFDLE